VGNGGVCARESGGGLKRGWNGSKKYWTAGKTSWSCTSYRAGWSARRDSRRDCGCIPAVPCCFPCDRGDPSAAGGEVSPWKESCRRRQSHYKRWRKTSQYSASPVPPARYSSSYSNSKPATEEEMSLEKCGRNIWASP